MRKAGDAELRAATIHGFRQGLEQVAAQLRAQAERWRKEANDNVLRAGFFAKGEARTQAMEVERWCGNVEQIATFVEAEAKRRQIDEQKALADAQLQAQREVESGSFTLRRLFRDLRRRR